MGVIVPAGCSLLIDISAAQGVIEWPAVLAWRGPLAEFVAGVGCKATEGNGYVDPQFGANWRGILSIGLPRGAYHFAHPDTIHANDAEAEARHFVATVEAAGGFRAGVDFLALDIEDVRSPQGRVFTDWVIKFCETVDALTGAVCGIYTGGPFFDAHDGTADPETIAKLAKRWLWIAAYVADPARYVALTAEWRAAGYVLHQRSGDQAPSGEATLHVGGIGHGRVNVDRDIFRGTLTDLRSWIRSLEVRGFSPVLREPGLELGDDSRPVTTIADEVHRLLADSDPPDTLPSHELSPVPATVPDTPTSKSSQRLRAVVAPILGGKDSDE